MRALHLIGRPVVALCWVGYGAVALVYVCWDAWHEAGVARLRQHQRKGAS